jgi:hypothetical protein
MCPVEINSDQVGGIYVDGVFTALPYTVASGEKRLISHKHPPGFRYRVFGTDRGGYYMEDHDPFNPRYELEKAQEIHLGQITMTGRPAIR